MRTIQNELRALEEAGLLVVVRRRAGRVNLPNAYRLNWGYPPKVEQLDDEDIEAMELGGGAHGAGGGAPRAPVVQETTKNTLGGGAPHAPGGAPRAPEPVIKPITTSSLRSEVVNKPGLGGSAQAGTRLPADWHPGDEGVAYAEARIPGRWERELEAFRDYWLAKPGKDGRKVDWLATWRNWIRKTEERLQRGGYGQRTAPQPTPVASMPYVPGGGLRRLA